LTLLAPLLGRPDRFGPTALVVALLQEKSRLFPDSICGNLVFRESLLKEKGFPPPFRVCYHLFGSPAPVIPGLLAPRDPEGTVSQAVSATRLVWLELFGDPPGSDGQVLCWGDYIVKTIINQYFYNYLPHF
jgi:hypothetical protein